MEHSKDNSNKNIERIKQRKKEREREERLRLVAVLLGVILVISLVVFGICSLVKFIQSLKPEPKPLPVSLMSYNSEILENTENENFVYTEPVKRPVKYDFDGTNDRLESVRAKASQKVCYLTFDDGPNLSITPQVLDVLRKYDVKATFFMVGALVESNFDVARRIFEEGHLLANHSYSHNYKNLYSSTDSFMTEITKTEELIKSVGDSEEDYFPIIRFPGGSYNAGTYKEQKQLIKEHLNTKGYYYCDWNSLNGDAEGARKDADGLFEYFKKNTVIGKPAVVLMHDAVTKQATVDSLPKIIEYMLDNGYTFLRLDENLE